MKKKIIYGLNLFWSFFTALLFPVSFALIYTGLTGHSKGYDYDLGPEKDISVMMGIIELVIWLVISLPSAVYVFLKTTAKKPSLYIVILILYIILAVIGVFAFTGSFSEYSKAVFNI